jgi:hypothetical protein
LSSIRSFCERHDETDIFRFLVCGIIWLSDRIGVNSRQLSLLLGKRPISINDSFRSVGYSAGELTEEARKPLRKAFPVLRKLKLDQWSVRHLPGSPGEASSVQPGEVVLAEGETRGRVSGENSEIAEIRPRPVSPDSQKQPLVDGDDIADSTPCYFERLSEVDRLGYTELRAKLCGRRSQLGSRDKHFREALSLIRSFCERHDETDIFGDAKCEFTDQSEIGIARSCPEVCRREDGPGESRESSEAPVVG